MLIGKALRVIQRTLENESSDGVDIDGGHIAAQAHGLQRDRTSARKGIEYFWRTPTVGFVDSFTEPVDVFAGLASPVQNAAFGLFYFLFLCTSTGKLFLFRSFYQATSEPF